MKHSVEVFVGPGKEEANAGLWVKFGGSQSSRHKILRQLIS
jgi:hypothetical protein